MSSPFSIFFHTEKTDHRAIWKNGFIACSVRFQAPRLVSKRMGFCLRCKELFSYNGALKHSKQLVDKHQVDLSRLFHVEKIDFYKQQITSDVERLWEKWSSKESGVQKDTVAQEGFGGETEIACTMETCPEHDTTHIAEESCAAELSSQGFDGRPNCVEQDPLFEEQWDCLEECLLSRWSSFPCLNPADRFEEAVTVLNNLFDGVDDQKNNVMKSRVISLILRQLSAQLSLTKNQNDQIVSFVKSMVVFIVPERESIARRIFASNSSRQRQSRKDNERKKLFV